MTETNTTETATETATATETDNRGIDRNGNRVVYHVDDPGYWVLCASHAERFADNPASNDYDGDGTIVVGCAEIIARGCDVCRDGNAPKYGKLDQAETD